MLNLPHYRALLGGFFTPASLFAAGEQGVWYDPSDLTTLFRDVNGNTPVTATSQSVALVLDKSKGLALGSELVSNGTFANTTGWTGNYAGSIAAVSGEGVLTATSTGYPSAYTSISCVIGKIYKITLKARVISANAGITAGVYVSDNTGAYVGPAIGTAATTLTQITVNFVATATTHYIAVAGLGGSVNSGSQLGFDDVSVREITGNHASQATSTARPVLTLDTNGCYYLSFDGADDALATASIDFSGTNKASIWFGARKLSDTGYMSIGQLSSSNANSGSFSFAASGNPDGATRDTWVATTLGTGNGTYGGAKAYSSPVTSVVSVMADNSGVTQAGQLKFRVNGASPASTVFGSNTSGTGNYANAPIYIGTTGSAAYFYGNMYGVIVRGAASKADEIVNTEAWMNTKTKAY